MILEDTITFHTTFGLFGINLEKLFFPEEIRVARDPDVIHYSNKQRIKAAFNLIFMYEQLNDDRLEVLYNWMIFNYDDNCDNKNIDCSLLSYGIKLYEEMR